MSRTSGVLRGGLARGLCLVAFLALPRTAAAQNARVVPGDVIDDRFSKGILTGALRVELGLEGDGLEAVKAARFLVKDAKDDTGASLLGKERDEPSFDTLDQQRKVRVDLANPARRAKSFRLSGKMELFVPSKDPKSVVTVSGALGAKDRPIASPGLKAAKIEVKLLSVAGYQELKKSQKLDDAKIAEVRAEAKKRGMSDEETDLAIEMVKAFQEMDEPLTESSVILSGKLADMEKIVEVALRRPDGSEVEGSRSSTSDRSTKTIVLQPRGDTADAVLVFTLLTDKAKVAVNVDLKDVPLP